MDNLSIHIRNFNEKVKIMNQTGGKMLSLTAADARNLHSDIFDLLTHVAELSARAESGGENIQVEISGGTFN